MVTEQIPNREKEKSRETDSLRESEVRPLRRSPRVKKIQNIKFVKSANTQEEGKLSVKENDSEGIKYMFFTNTMGTSHVLTTDMIGTSQNERRKTYTRY